MYGSIIPFILLIPRGNVKGRKRAEAIGETMRDNATEIESLIFIHGHFCMQRRSCDMAAIVAVTRNSTKIYPFLLGINSLANTINADEDQKKWRPTEVAHEKLNSFA